MANLKITEYPNVCTGTAKTDLMDISKKVSAGSWESQQYPMEHVKKIEGEVSVFSASKTFDLSYNRVHYMPISDNGSVSITGEKANGSYYIYLKSDNNYRYVTLTASFGELLKSKQGVHLTIENQLVIEPTTELLIRVLVDPSGNKFYYIENPTPALDNFNLNWFSSTAYHTGGTPDVETFDPSTKDDSEISATQDYAIMPKIVQNTKTGTMFHYFSVSSGHESFADRSAIFRKSVDGGKTWTAMDGGTSPAYTNVDFFGDGSNYDMSGGGCTKTGRVILFFRRFNAGGTLIAYYSIYTDDDGLTWSTPVDRGNLGQYVFDTKFMFGERGEILLLQSRGSSSSSQRNIAMYHSFDNGDTFIFRSQIYAPAKQYYAFAEGTLRDFGNGLFIAVVRNAAYVNGAANITSGVFAGMDLPMCFVSWDYCKTWAGDNETITETELNNGEHNSGWLPLEGLTESLGNGGYANALPWLERVDYKGQKYMLIAYYCRSTITAEGRDEVLRLQAIKVDEWIARGYKAIKDIAITVYLADNSASSAQYDGNGALFLAGERPEFLWTLCDNLTSSPSGTEVIRTSKCMRTTVETLLDSIESANDIS